MKRIVLLFPLLLIFNLNLTAESSNIFSLNAVPYGILPLGNSEDIFELGYGVELQGNFIPEKLKFAGLGAELEYSYLPIKTADAIGIASGGIGPAFLFPLGERFKLFAQAYAGYYIYQSLGWDSSNANKGGYSLKAGAGAAFKLAGTFSLGLGASYGYYDKLYNGMSLSLYGRFDFGTKKKTPIRTYSNGGQQLQLMKRDKSEKGRGVELKDIELSALYPVLYKNYESEALGTLRLVNFEDQYAEQIQLSFFVERYMDNPTYLEQEISLGPNEEVLLDLYGLFTEDMLEITEGSKVSVKMNISYSMKDKDNSRDYTPNIELHNRNALSWDDDKKIVSFITAKDPEILNFSKNVTNWMQEFKNPSVDDNLQKGMALFEAVRVYGVGYEVDPASPFAGDSIDSQVVDFIQFPRQTLGYTTGDCDDLTALYAALLESVGVETAIITVPGHIYMALALKEDPETLRQKTIRPDEFIFRDDKVWIPIEITLFQKSFEEAWLRGAKQWRDYDRKKLANFYPTHTAWQQYQPVGFSEELSGIEIPAQYTVMDGFNDTIRRYVEQEIYPQEVTLKEKIATAGDKAYGYQNKLAVLYARYGLYEKALLEFESIIRVKNYSPSMVNAANIYYIQQQFEKALNLYESVLTVNKRSKSALLGAARCNHELEQYSVVKKYYQELKDLDPGTANKYAYLDTGGNSNQRASDALALEHSVIWEEEK